MDDALRRIASVAPIVPHSLAARDGTRLAAYVVGRGPRVWVIPPGLGTPISAWSRVFARFSDDFTFVTWDLRGTFASGAPRDLSRLRVEDHVDDLELLVAHLGLTRFVLGGWSLGVQLSLEYAQRHPDAVEALVLINGTYEHILRTALRPGLEPALRLAVRGLVRLADRAAPLIRAGVALGPVAMPRLGLLARSTPHFAEVLSDFATLDWKVYFRLMLAVSAHSAAPGLGAIRAPALITAGDADRLTPVATARALHAALPTSEFALIPRGTHYTQTEFPEALNALLADFFARHPAP